VRSRKIIELARAGERNADRLTARALAEFGIEGGTNGVRRQLADPNPHEPEGYFNATAGTEIFERGSTAKALDLQ
jgi:hypothetical protein